MPPAILSKSGGNFDSTMHNSAAIKHAASTFTAKSRQSFADRSSIKIISKDGHRNMVEKVEHFNFNTMKSAKSDIKIL